MSATPPNTDPVHSPPAGGSVRDDLHEKAAHCTGQRAPPTMAVCGRRGVPRRAARPNRGTHQGIVREWNAGAPTWRKRRGVLSWCARATTRPARSTLRTAVSRTRDAGPRRATGTSGGRPSVTWEPGGSGSRGREEPPSSGAQVQNGTTGPTREFPGTVGIGPGQRFLHQPPPREAKVPSADGSAHRLVHQIVEVPHDPPRASSPPSSRAGRDHHEPLKARDGPDPLRDTHGRDRTRMRGRPSPWWRRVHERAEHSLWTAPERIRSAHGAAGD